MADLDFKTELIEKCKSGNHSAQYELYNLYAKSMYNICLRMMKNTMDAEDMLQSSFIDVYRKLHQFSFQSTPGAWIKRIVVNNCTTELKKRRLDLVPITERTEVTNEPFLQDQHFDITRIKKALFKLPDGYRIVLSLYLMEGYDHQEIASILDITESTSKSQYSRARKKLKQILLTDGIDALSMIK